VIRSYVVLFEIEQLLLGGHLVIEKNDLRGMLTFSQGGYMDLLTGWPAEKVWPLAANMDNSGSGVFLSAPGLCRIARRKDICHDRIE